MSSGDLAVRHVATIDDHRSTGNATLTVLKHEIPTRERDLARASAATTSREDQLSQVPWVKQQPLPIPWQLAQTGNHFDERNFAHPAEVTFSRILNFYRVRWSYEPTTFVLSYGPEGLPAEMFTPDFYLPELKLYVELTMMRQRLVTRKNRKLRRLRELYPDIRIKLLYRRDCERLSDAYRETSIDLDHCQLGRTLFTEQDITARIATLAHAICSDHRTRRRSGTTNARSFSALLAPHQPCSPVPMWREPGDISSISVKDLAVSSKGPTLGADSDRLLVIGVDQGSARFATNLAEAIEANGLAIDRDRITMTRHQSPSGERRVKVARGPRSSVAGRRVLLVTDVISTGLSHAYLIAWLKRRGAVDVQVCTLLDRASARLVDVPIRYAAFEAPNDLLVGFGLHLRRQFRHLPYIATLVSEPFTLAAD